MGFGQYIASVDCMVMGRKCMEKIVSFNLGPEQWPYGDIRIVVLSNTITGVPTALPLFGPVQKQLKLEQAQTPAYPNDFVQLRYTVNYS